MTSSQASLELDLEQLREELVQYYLDVLCKIKFIPWDEESYVDLPKFFTKLSIVMQDTISMANGQRNVLPLEGSHNGIFTIGYSGGHRAPGRVPTRILLEGEAGMGKTTLVAKLAHDWATRADSSALKDLPLFLAIPLREWDPAWSIGTAVRQCILAKDSTITAKQIDNFIKTNPKAAKIVLDGYDEAGFRITDSEGSGRIGSILRNEELRDCPILVTTRQWRVPEFRDFLRHYTRIEINGFQREETRRYVESFFKVNPSKSEKLMKYIDEHHLVSKYLSGIPLFTAMLCKLVSESQTQVDDLDEFDTLSDLFRYFTSYLWGQYVTKCKSFKHPERSEEILMKLLISLGETGIKGLFTPEKKLTFSSSDFTSCSKEDKILTDETVDEVGCKVGLLSKRRSQIQLKTKLKRRTISEAHSFSFFHKLAQEYCAGVYLAHLARNSDTELNQYLQRVCSHSDVLEHKNVLLFACGEGVDATRKILAHLARLAEKWVYIWDTNNNAFEIALLCNLECKGAGKMNEDLKKFFKTGELEVFMSPFQLEPHISVAYKYLMSNQAALPMKNCQIHITKKEHLHVFCHIISCRNTSLLTGVHLDLKDLKEDSFLQFLECLRSNSRLSSLEVTLDYQQHILALLAEAPNSCRYPSVRQLKLNNKRSSSTCTQDLKTSLHVASSRFPNVKELNLDNVKCGTEIVQEEDETQLASLTHLTISDVACVSHPVGTLCSTIARACPQLVHLSLELRDNVVVLEAHDPYNSKMNNLRSLDMSLSADQVPLNKFVALLSQFTPGLVSLSLSLVGQLSYDIYEGPDAIEKDKHEALVCPTVEHINLTNAFHNNYEFQQFLAYFPGAKSVETFNCEPFTSSQTPTPSSPESRNVTNMTVNCSSTKLSNIMPNFFVMSNDRSTKQPTSLGFLETFHHLRSLTLINLPFKTLDLSGCPDLPTVSHLRLQGLFLQCSKGIADFFKKLPHLQSCQIPYSVSDAIIDELIAALSGMENLRLLVVGLDSGLPENVIKMVEAVASLSCLEHLVFRINSFHDTLMVTLAMVLPVWPRLNHLGIHQYILKEQHEAVKLEQMTALAEACALHDPLRVLDLSLMKLTKEAAVRVLETAKGAVGSSGQFRVM